MRNLLYISVFLTGVFVLTLLFSQASFAQCVVTGATPGGGEVVVCNGNDPNGITTTNLQDDVTVQPGADISRNGDHVIETLDDDDVVRINGGVITADSNNFDCINLGAGNNELHMITGTLTNCDHGIRSTNPGTAKITIDGGLIDASTGNDEGISTGNGNDEITINGGEIIGGEGGIQTFFGNDIITVTGGRIVQINDSDETIETSNGNDLISVSNAIVDGSMASNNLAILGSSDDDTVKLGTGAEILGIISGGDDFDTLVFEMEVPTEAIDFICSQIFSMDPQEGSITINDLFYEWEEFEVLQCDLQPVSIARPIPTLSEWGLIAMAGVLGIIGLIAIQRRKIAA